MLVVWEGAFIKCFRGEPLQWRGLWMNYGFMHKIRPSLTYYLAERPKIFEIVRRRKFCRSSFQSLASIPIPFQSLFVAKTELNFSSLEPTNVDLNLASKILNRWNHLKKSLTDHEKCPALFTFKEKKLLIFLQTCLSFLPKGPLWRCSKYKWALRVSTVISLIHILQTKQLFIKLSNIC